MERIWLKSYPPGVPQDIDPSEYGSLVDLFERSIRAYGERPAFTCMGKTLTFSELDVLALGHARRPAAGALGHGVVELVCGRLEALAGV